MKKSAIFSLILCVAVFMFSIPAFAITEQEFKAICLSGSVERLREVIKATPNFAKLRFREMDTPLIIAADRTAHPDFIQIIIDTGVDVNAQNEDGETALMEMMDYPVSLACVQAMLKAGANPNLRDEEGKTALMKALKDDLPSDIISTLLDAGADPKIKDKKGHGTVPFYSSKAYRLHGTAVMQRLEAAAAAK